MIELSGIHKSFNDKEVIKGIELNVDKGEVVTLIDDLVQVKRHYYV